jgi:hypothetical protein
MCSAQRALPPLNARNPNQAAAHDMNHERHESHESGRQQPFLCSLRFLLFLPFLHQGECWTGFNRKLAMFAAIPGSSLAALRAVAIANGCAC